MRREQGINWKPRTQAQHQLTVMLLGLQEEGRLGEFTWPKEYPTETPEEYLFKAHIQTGSRVKAIREYMVDEAGVAKRYFIYFE